MQLFGQAILSLAYILPLASLLHASDAASTLYDILRVERFASVDDIKRRYVELAKQFNLQRELQHGSDGSSAERDDFIELTRAYQVLVDSDKRREYDQSLWGSSSTGSRRAEPDVKDDPFASFKYGQGGHVRGDGASNSNSGDTMRNGDFRKEKDTWSVSRSKDGKKVFTSESGFTYEFKGQSISPASWFAVKDGENAGTISALWPWIQLLFVTGACALACIAGCFWYLGRVFFPNPGTKKVKKSDVAAKVLREQKATSSSISQTQSQSQPQPQPVRPTSRTSTSPRTTHGSASPVYTGARTLPKATEHTQAIKRRGVLIIISLNTAMSRKLVHMKDKFANDSIEFYSYIPEACVPGASTGSAPAPATDEFDILALSKGAQRWCAFSHDEHGYTLSDVDAWLVSLLAGHVQWVPSAESPPPLLDEIL